MKDTLLALSLLASTVSAQQATSAPKALFKQAQAVVSFGAADGDDGAEICLNSSEVLLACGEDFGGTEGIQDVSIDEVLACACCDSGRAIWSEYESCSSYMETGMPSFTSEADAYGQMATMCSEMGACSARASSSSLPTQTSEEEEVEETTSFITSTEEVPAAFTPDGTSECNEMYYMYETCIDKTKGFETLGFKSQAECYCCESSRGQTSGTLTWTDKIDEYASVCWDWAEDSATDDSWDYASRFATFCDNFSDVCDSMSFTADAAENTDSETRPQDTQPRETGEVTVTVTNTKTQTSETGEPDAAVGLRAGSVGGVAGLVAALLLL